MKYVSVGIIISSDEAILIGRRRNEQIEGGCWEFPGGKIERGESPKSALQRELYEEVGIKHIAPSFFMKYLYNYQAYEVQLYFYFVFTSTQHLDNVQYSQYAWVKPEELNLYNFVASDVHAIQVLQQEWSEIWALRQSTQVEQWIFGLQHSLLIWYQQNMRLLPWRDTSDPYAILVSEIMLQQTQVDTVREYYQRFMHRFPTVYALATASLDDVNNVWAGLGYYRRARLLKQCAEVLVNQFQGEFPKDYKTALSLPGVGPYTGGAVLSIAYNLAFPAVDGNVLRVASRLCNSHDDIARASTRNAITKRIATWLPEDRRHFNQALMELGALICRPKQPLCIDCPLDAICQARQLGTETQLPIKTKSKAKKQVIMEIALIRWQDNILLERRPEQGLLAGMWGLPTSEVKTSNKSGSHILHLVQSQWEFKVASVAFCKRVGHVFTHLKWEMLVYDLDLEQKPCLKGVEYLFVPITEILSYPIPKVFMKCLDHLLNS